MNIFKIEQELQEIFNEIEENEGELTPELEERLKITQDNFKNKIESYVNAIKYKNGELSVIAEEIDRLKSLYESKTKFVNRLNKCIIHAINNFGYTTKSGSKAIDYLTGKITIRKNQIVKTNDELIKSIGDKLLKEILIRKEDNQLTVLGILTKEDLINCINDENVITKEDLDNVKCNISVEVSLNDLLTEYGYDYINDCISLSPKFKLDTKVSKSDLKNKLKDNGSCAPNIAKLDYSESLIIK